MKSDKEKIKLLLNNNTKLRKINIILQEQITELKKVISEKDNPVVDPDTEVSNDVQEIFSFWLSCSNLTRHKTGTKTAQAIIKILTKKLKKEPLKDIKAAIKTYDSMISSKSFKYGKRKPYFVGLLEFFKFNTYTKTANKHLPIIQNNLNWYKECKKGLVYLQDTYCKHTSGQAIEPIACDSDIRQFMVDGFNKTLNTITELDIYTVNHFAQCTNNIIKYQQLILKKRLYSENLHQGALTDIKVFIQYMFDYLKQLQEYYSRQQKEIEPSWLSKDFFINNFENYMVRKKLIKKSNRT